MKGENNFGLDPGRADMGGFKTGACPAERLPNRHCSRLLQLLEPHTKVVVSCFNFSPS
jgi:hypothetical protein